MSSSMPDFIKSTFCVPNINVHISNCNDIHVCIQKLPNKIAKYFAVMEIQRHKNRFRWNFVRSFGRWDRLRMSITACIVVVVVCCMFSLFFLLLCCIAARATAQHNLWIFHTTTWTTASGGTIRYAKKKILQNHSDCVRLLRVLVRIQWFRHCITTKTWRQKCLCVHSCSLFKQFQLNGLKISFFAISVHIVRARFYLTRGNFNQKLNNSLFLVCFHDIVSFLSWFLFAKIKLNECVCQKCEEHGNFVQFFIFFILEKYRHRIDIFVLNFAEWKFFCF